MFSPKLINITLTKSTLFNKIFTLSKSVYSAKP